MASGREPSIAKPQRKSRRLRFVIVLLAALVGFYLLVCAFAFTAQRHILFPAPKIGRKPPDGAGRLITVDQGTPMFFHPPTAGNPVLVFFHGNGDQIADVAGIAVILSRHGLGFATIEYPGYGLAVEQGPPSEAKIFAAAERGILYLLEKEGLAKEQLVMGGFSLGTGVAMAMAERGYGVRVLLTAPFTSIPDVAAGAFPFLPVRQLLKDHFDSAARAPSVRVPVLVVHGTDDEVVPISHGKSLAARFSTAQFIALEGAMHNGLWSNADALEHMIEFVRGARAN